MALQTFYPSEQDAGQRVDKFLARELGLSRREALRLLEGGFVCVNTKTLSLRDKGRLLNPGDVLNLEADAQTLLKTVAPDPDMALEVLAEGDGFVVVDKPAGVPVMPLRPGERGTVLNALVARYPQLQGVGEGGLRSGVVHRLDTDTSGTLLVATEEMRWQRLREAFKQHRTTKRYRAVVQGQLTGAGAEVLHLAVTRHRPAKVSVVEAETPGSRRCDLSWRALETFNDATLLEVTLGTGFLHQIRAIFAHKGHPVLGDTHYGNPSPLVKRQMLHSSYLRVEGIEAASPDPADFVGCLKKLKEG